MPETPNYDIWRMTTGVEAKVQMPNLYAILATVGAVPSQAMIEVLTLLDQEGVALAGVDEGQKFLRIRNNIRGMYAMASLILVEPRLVLDKDPGEGEIGPRDLSLTDVEALYWRYFRGGYRPPPRSPADPADPDGAEEPTSYGGDLRDTAEPLFVDR